MTVRRMEHVGIRGRQPCGAAVLHPRPGGDRRRAGAEDSLTAAVSLGYERPHSAVRKRSQRAVVLVNACAGEDLNLHGVLTPQGPQPCASTNSATSARRPL